MMTIDESELRAACQDAAETDRLYGADGYEEDEYGDLILDRFDMSNLFPGEALG